MNNIRLFIENTEVELNEKVSFAITKQFEDLTNPTTIIADWSKTVEIPFTENNNNLFGHIYNVDRLIAEGGSSLTGIYFNPYKKLDFRLLYGDNLVMSGYAKMVDIKRSNGLGYYNITLNGSVGKIFQELKKYTFDTTYEDEDYIINNGIVQYINKELIESQWSGVTSDSTIKFSFDNAFNDKFDYTSIEQKTHKNAVEIISLADKLEDEKSFSSKSKIEASTVIGNGLMPRDYGEVRSYLTKPFILMKDLFDIFFTNFCNKTGYTVVKDNEFFTNNNPYWNNYAMLLKRFTDVSNASLIETAVFKTDKIIISGSGTMEKQYKNGLYENEYRHLDLWLKNIWNTPETTPIVFSNEYHTYYNVFNWEQNRIDFNAYESFSTSGFLEFSIQLIRNDNNTFKFFDIYDNPILFSSGDTVDLCTEAAIIVTINVLDDNNVIKEQVRNCIVSKNTMFDTDDYDNVIEFNPLEVVEVGYMSYAMRSSENKIPLSLNLQQTTYGDYATIQVSVEYAKTMHSAILTPFIYKHNDIEKQAIPSKMANYIDLYGDTSPQRIINSIIKGIKTTNEIRTGSNFNLNMLWDNKYSPFDIILNYCKMFRIYVSVDEYTKQIKFIQANNLFRNNVTLDWTNKLDLSKDYIITPISFDNKYVLFNYDDDKTKLGKEYKSKYGVNYGEKKLITQYNFNEDTKKLFTNIKNGIINTDYVLSWLQLYDQCRVMYGVPADIYAYNKGEDNKTVDTFGTFYFYNGNTYFDFNGELVWILPQMYISDDTSEQTKNKKYTYLSHLQKDGYINTKLQLVTRYSKLDNVCNGKLSLFNNPNEIFTFSDKSHYSNATSIYDGYWKKYIEERYNIQNKKVTCYIRLKPNDFYTFKFSNFVKINNQLYVVNKIYDYDITSDESTKVDLITIQDTNAYTQYTV